MSARRPGNDFDFLQKSAHETGTGFWTNFTIVLTSQDPEALLSREESLDRSMLIFAHGGPLANL